MTPGSLWWKKTSSIFKAFVMLRQTQKRIMNWRIMLHKAKRVSLKISPLQIEHYCFSIAHWVPIKSTLPHGVRLEITIIKSQWPIRCKWHHCSLIIKLFSCHVSAQWKGSFFLKNVYLYMKGCGSLFWGGHNSITSYFKSLPQYPLTILHMPIQKLSLIIFTFLVNTNSIFQLNLQGVHGLD